MKRVILFVLMILVLFSMPSYAKATNSMVLIEASTARILASENANDRLPMASLTKIMTALVVLNSVEDLDKTVLIDKRSVGIEGSSMYLKSGQVVTVRELLYGLMLASGNDAAMALAYHVSDSVEEFASLMNETAKQLELRDTHFKNPSGLYEDGHYTSAIDFARLTAFALQNETFSEIVKTKTYSVGSTTLVNHNRLLGELDGCIGVKTGYTKACGRCLVSAVERDGVLLICVTLNCSDDWETHKYLYSKHFKRCVYTKLLNEKEIYASLSVAGGKNVGYYCKQVSGVVIDESTDVQYKVYVPPFIYANKKTGDTVGRVDVLCDGVVLASSPLILDRDTETLHKRSSFFSKLFEFVLHMFKF